MKKILFVTISLFIFLAFTNGVPFIYSDGYAAFHTTQAVVEEGSWVFSDKPEHYDYRGHVIDQNIETGEYTVVYPPGTAIFNLPGQFIANLFENDSATIYTDYFKATNGHTLAEGFAFLITANIVGLLTLVLLYKTLKSLTNDKKIAVISTTISYIASYAIWYVMLSPSFTHTYELFGVTLATYGIVKYELMSKTREIDNKKILSKYAMLSGIGIGIATLCRPVLGVFGIGIVLYYFFQLIKSIIFDLKTSTKIVENKELSGDLRNEESRIKTMLNRYKPFVFFILGGIPSAILLFWYNYVSYGKLIASGYNESRGETFQFEEWNGLKILFSFERGWFIYSPVFFLGVIGLIFLWRKSKFLSIYSLTSIFSLVLIYGFWPAWWAGGSYGHRFMIPAMPFAALGLGYLLKYIKDKNTIIGLKIIVKTKIININLSKVIYSLIIILTFWSLTLTLLYRFTPVAELKPKDEIVYSGGRIWPSGDRYTPKDIFNYHYELITNANGMKGYVSDLIDSGNGGNSIIPILLGAGNVTLRIQEYTDQNWVSFNLIKPPVIRYEFTEPINFILVDNLNAEIYTGEIKFPNAEANYELDFGNNSVRSISESMVLTSNVYFESPYLPREEYKAFYLKSREYSIYFKNTDKLFFKGDEIRLDDTDLYYKL